MVHTYRDIPGAGTTLQLQIAGVYATVPGASDISWDGFTRGVRTPTPLSALAVVKKPGMTNFGQVKCKVYYDPNDTTHQAIVNRIQMTAAAASAAIDNWKIIYADGLSTPAEADFTGFVSDFSHAAGEPETGTMTADMTIEVTSVTGFYAGTGGDF